MGDLKEIFVSGAHIHAHTINLKSVLLWILFEISFFLEFHLLYLTFFAFAHFAISPSELQPPEYVIELRNITCIHYIHGKEMETVTLIYFQSGTVLGITQTKILLFRTEGQRGESSF